MTDFIIFKGDLAIDPFKVMVPIIEKPDYEKQPPEVFYKKVFLKISQNSQESACARISFIIKACNPFKKENLAQLFPVNFAKFLTTHFLQDTFPTTASGWLRLLVKSVD